VSSDSQEPEDAGRYEAGQLRSGFSRAGKHFAIRRNIRKLSNASAFATGRRSTELSQLPCRGSFHMEHVPSPGRRRKIRGCFADSLAGIRQKKPGRDAPRLIQSGPADQFVLASAVVVNQIYELLVPPGEYAFTTTEYCKPGVSPVTFARWPRVGTIGPTATGKPPPAP